MSLLVTRLLERKRVGIVLYVPVEEPGCYALLLEILPVESSKPGTGRIYGLVSIERGTRYIVRLRIGGVLASLTVGLAAYNVHDGEEYRCMSWHGACACLWIGSKRSGQ